MLGRRILWVKLMDDTKWALKKFIQFTANFVACCTCFLPFIAIPGYLQHLSIINRDGPVYLAYVGITAAPCFVILPSIPIVMVIAIIGLLASIKFGKKMAINSIAILFLTVINVILLFYSGVTDM